MKYFLILLFISTTSYSSEIKQLKNFKTDFCTYFPEGTGARPTLWKDCCIYHDMKYWIGGTHAEQDKADITLRECVRKKANGFYAGLMYRGVRLGHYSPIKSKYRWGWGWHKKGFYGNLTHEQLKQAKALIQQSGEDRRLINRFIKEYLESNLITNSP